MLDVMLPAFEFAKHLRLTFGMLSPPSVRGHYDYDYFDVSRFMNDFQHKPFVNVESLALDIPLARSSAQRRLEIANFPHLKLLDLTGLFNYKGLRVKLPKSLISFRYCGRLTWTDLQNISENASFTEFVWLGCELEESDVLKLSDNTNVVDLVAQPEFQACRLPSVKDFHIGYSKLQFYYGCPFYEHHNCWILLALMPNLRKLRIERPPEGSQTRDTFVSVLSYTPLISTLIFDATPWTVKFIHQLIRTLPRLREVYTDRKKSTNIDKLKNPFKSRTVTFHTQPLQREKPPPKSISLPDMDWFKNRPERLKRRKYRGRE